MIIKRNIWHLKCVSVKDVNIITNSEVFYLKLKKFKISVKVYIAKCALMSPLGILKVVLLNMLKFKILKLGLNMLSVICLIPVVKVVYDTVNI